MSKILDLVNHYHDFQMYGKYPYLFHLNQVANKVIELRGGLSNHPDILLLNDIAWLHDILEDTECTEEVLREELYDYPDLERLIEAIVAITKLPNESRETYIKRCKKCYLAHEVKIADTMCNLQASIISNESKRIRRYLRQLDELLEE